MKGKISQIDEIKQIIQNNKNTIEVKKKEIEEARKFLMQKQMNIIRIEKIKKINIKK